MHDNKYLHLPVVEESSGKVLGVVAVMEIILAIAGEEGSTGYVAILSPPVDMLHPFMWSILSYNTDLTQRAVRFLQPIACSGGKRCSGRL